MSRTVYWFMLCFGLGITVAVVSVTVSGLIGAELAPSLYWATLPYGLQFIGVMLSAIASSWLQSLVGRKPVILLACLLLIVSAVLGALSVVWESFILLCVAHFLIGVFLANNSLLRFAALDLTPKIHHAKALSIVVFGGTFAALLGPFISRNAGQVFASLHPYIGVYSAIGAIGIILTMLVACMRFRSNTLESGDTESDTTEETVAQATTDHSSAELIHNRLYVFAVVCGGVAFGLMNLLMINSSIQMKAQGFQFEAVTYFIQMHVLAMFFPSLFNMKILAWMGINRFLVLGLCLQLMTSMVFVFEPTAFIFGLALILLGLAWNILYTAGSYLVGELYSEGAIKFKAQGINDLFVGMLSAFGALSAGALLAGLGWGGLQVLAVIITAVLAVFYVSLAKSIRQRLTVSEQS